MRNKQGKIDKNKGNPDTDGFYQGDLSKQCGANNGAPSNVTGTESGPSLGYSVNIVTYNSHTGLRRGLIDLFNMDSSQESGNGSDVEMVPPVQETDRSRSMADLFADDDDLESEDSYHDDPSIPLPTSTLMVTFIADLYGSDSNESVAENHKRSSMADLYGGDTDESKPETKTKQRSLMADLFSGETDESEPESNNNAAASAAASASKKQKLFTMADFDYVAEDEFADVDNDSTSGSDSD